MRDRACSASQRVRLNLEVVLPDDAKARVELVDDARALREETTCVAVRLVDRCLKRVAGGRREEQGSQRQRSGQQQGSEAESCQQSREASQDEGALGPQRIRPPPARPAPRDGSPVRPVVRRLPPSSSEPARSLSRSPCGRQPTMSVVGSRGARLCRLVLGKCPIRLAMNPLRWHLEHKRFPRLMTCKARRRGRDE